MELSFCTQYLSFRFIYDPNFSAITVWNYSSLFKGTAEKIYPKKIRIQYTLLGRHYSVTVLAPAYRSTWVKNSKPCKILLISLTIFWKRNYILRTLSYLYRYMTLNRKKETYGIPEHALLENKWIEIVFLFFVFRIFCISTLLLLYSMNNKFS